MESKDSSPTRRLTSLTILAVGILFVSFSLVTFKNEALAQIASPTNFQASPQTFTIGDSVRFSWSGVSGADYYETRAPSLGLSNWYRAAAGTETGVTISNTNHFPTGSHQIELRACTNAGSCSSQTSLTIMVLPRLRDFSLGPISRTTYDQQRGQYTYWIEVGSPFGVNWQVVGGYYFRLLVANNVVAEGRRESGVQSFEVGGNYTQGYSRGSTVSVVLQISVPDRRDFPIQMTKILTIDEPTSPQNPRISIPSNIIQSISATAQWSADYATRYKIYSDFAPMWETNLTSFTWSGDYTRIWPQNPDGPDHWVYVQACNDRGNCVDSQRAYFRVYPLNYTVPTTSTYSSAAPSRVAVYISKTRIIEGIDFAYLSWAADVSDVQTTYTIRASLNKVGTAGTLEIGGATSKFWPQTETALWPTGNYSLTVTACNRGRCATSSSISFSVELPPAPTNLVLEFAPVSPYQGGYMGVNFSAKGQGINYFKIESDLPGLRHEQSWDSSRGTLWDWGGFRTWDIKITKDWQPGRHWISLVACAQGLQCSNIRREIIINPPPLPAGPWIFASPGSMDETGGSQYVSISWGAENPVFQYTIISDPFNKDKPRGPYAYEQDLETNEISIRTSWTGRVESPGWWPVGRHWFYNRTCNTSGCAESDVATIMSFANRSGEPLSYDLSNPPSNPVLNIPSSVGAGSRFSASWSAGGSSREYVLHSDLLPKGGVSTGGGWSGGSTITSYEFQNTAFWPQGEHWAQIEACNFTTCVRSPKQTFRVLPPGSAPTNPRFLSFPANITQGNNFFASWIADNATRYILHSNLFSAVGLPEAYDFGPTTSFTWTGDATINWPPGNYYAYIEAFNDYGRINGPTINFAVLATIPQAPQGFNSSRNPIHTNETTTFTWNQPTSGTAPVDRYELNIPSLNINWQNLGRVFTYNFSTLSKGNHAVSLRACNGSQCSEVFSLAVPLLVDDPVLTTSFTLGSSLLYNQSVSFSWLAYGATCRVVVDTSPPAPLSSCNNTYTALASDFGFGSHSVYYQSCNSLGCVDSGRAGFTVILPAPTNLTISPSLIRQGKDIVVSWQASAGAVRYEMKSPGLHTSLNDWVDVGNITTFTLPRRDTANFNTGEFTVFLRSCALAYPNQTACSDFISIPFTVYGPYPRITITPAGAGPSILGLDRPDPFVIYPVAPPTGELEAVTYNFNFTINDSPAEDLLIAASIPTNTSFDSAEPYHDQAPRRCLFQGADFIYWDYWRGRTVPMGTNETLTFRLRPQFSGLLNAPQTVGVKIFVISSYGEVYGQTNINWQAIDSQCLTVQPTKTLQEAGIELNLPSYLPEELRHPQKLFSDRTIKIPLESSQDIKKMRLEIENQTIRGDVAKTTLLPKDKTLDFMKEQGQEPPEFIKQDVSFKIPENIVGGTYNLKLFAENQKLKDVNVQIQGLTPNDTRYKLSTNESHPSVVSGVERGYKLLHNVFETVISGDHNGPGMVLLGVAGQIFRYSEKWNDISIDQLFFGTTDLNNLPFGSASDRKVKVLGNTFYLASNIGVMRERGNALRPFLAGGFYRGCVADIASCHFKAGIFRDVPENIRWDLTSVASDYSKIAINSENGAIYIISFTNDGSVLYISRDSGDHFQEVEINSVDGVVENMEVGIDGKLYIVSSYVNYESNNYRRHNIFQRLDSAGNLEIRRSLDVFVYGLPSISSGSRRGWIANNLPAIAIDKGSGPYRGRIYTVWAKPERVLHDSTFEYSNRGENFDVFLSYSDDQGTSWSVPRKINDDTGTGDQLFPSIDVDDNGIVNIAFSDHRNNQDLAQFDVYYTLSQNGSKTFSRNLQVNQRPIPNPFGGRYWGDYLDLVHGKTGQGVSYTAYPCIDIRYGHSPGKYLGDYYMICIDQIYTGATVARE